MASKTDICNLALVRLGEPPVLSLDDTSKRANALKSYYDLALDILLQDHPWNFATRRATLARLTAAPDFGYSYAYQLPSGCLRVLGMVGDGYNIDPSLNYKLEGQQLLTDESAVKIKYILRVTETGMYGARFCSALASRLALELSYHLVKSPALQGQMLKLFGAELSAAKAIDAQEDTPEVYESNEWLEARL